MIPEFLFLGTGPAEPIPRQGHRDALCADALRPRSKSRRTRSAGVYRKGKTAILIDAGPDLLYQLATYRIDRLDAVLLTHAHLDAAGGLAGLSSWADKRGIELPVYTEQATERRYGRFPGLKYRFVNSGAVAKIGDVSVRFFRVRHSVQPGFPTLGFRIGKFAYASDASSVPTPSRRMLQGVTTFALDAAFWFGTNFRGHMKTDEAIRVGHWLGIGHLLLTQTGHTYPPHHEAEPFIRHYAHAHARGMKVTLAWDGLHLKLG